VLLASNDEMFAVSEKFSSQKLLFYSNYSSNLCVVTFFTLTQVRLNFNFFAEVLICSSLNKSGDRRSQQIRTRYKLE